MEIAFEDMRNTETALMHVLSMNLHPKGYSSVRYADAGREDHLLYYHLAGARRYLMPDGKRMECAPGDILLLPMGSRYCTYTGPDEANGYIIRFDLMDEAGNKVGICGGPRFLLHDSRVRFLTDFETMYALSMRMGSTLKQKERLAGLLLEMLAFSPQPSADAWLPAAQEYMADHLQHPVTVSQLANLCHMSERTFCRKFREKTGVSPVSYHRSLRLKKAGELLSSGICTLEYVAETLGFTDAAHLSRAFFKETGIHPGKLKENPVKPVP